MKKYLLFLIAILFPWHVAFGAIAFTSATNIAAGSGPYTATIDGGTGANRLFIFAALGDTSDNMNAPTWNGETFTLAGKTLWTASTRYAYIWYLVPSGTGSQTFSMTGPSDTSIMTVMLYSGAGVPINYVTNQNTGTTGSITASPAPASTSWLAGVGGNLSANLVGGTNTTIRSVASAIGQADSNGVASPTALAYTWGGGSTTWYADAVEIPMAVVATPVRTPILSLIRSWWF